MIFLSRHLARSFLGIAFFALASVLFPRGAWALDTIWVDEARLTTGKVDRMVRLPHAMSDLEVAESDGRARLHMEFVLPKPLSASVGIYIPKMSISGNLTINGHNVGSCAPGNLESVRCLHQPTFYEVPSGILTLGRNSLELDLFVNDRQINGVSKIAIGDAQEVYEQLFWRHWVKQVTLLQALTWITVFLGMMSLAVSIILRNESVYIWFALACFLNALSNINGLIRTVPVHLELYSWFVFSTRLVSAPLLMLTILSFFQKRWTWARYWLIAYCLCAPIIVHLSGNSKSWVAALHAFNLAGGVVILGASLYWSFTSRNKQQMFLSASYFLVAAAAIHDWFKFLGPASFEATYLIAYAGAGSLLFMGAVIVGLLVRALQTSRDLTLTLEGRILERERALAHSYQELVELNQQAARAEERERLMREVHDGLGSGLSSARLALQSGKGSVANAAELIGECIDDLRLLLEASSNDEGLMSNALADYRYRMQRRLESAGVESQWNTSLEEEPHWPQGYLLQVMRIVQEAIQNINKHAEAKRITVDVNWLGELGELHIQISDDGIGFDDATLFVKGRGIKNMLSRAQALGGRLQYLPVARGTLLQLTVPFRSKFLADSPRSGIRDIL